MILWLHLSSSLTFTRTVKHQFPPVFIGDDEGGNSSHFTITLTKSHDSPSFLARVLHSHAQMYIDQIYNCDDDQIFVHEERLNVTDDVTRATFRLWYSDTMRHWYVLVQACSDDDLPDYRAEVAFRNPDGFLDERDRIALVTVPIWLSVMSLILILWVTCLHARVRVEKGHIPLIVMFCEYILFESFYTAVVHIGNRKSISAVWFTVLLWAEIASQLVMFAVVFLVVSRFGFTHYQFPICSWIVAVLGILIFVGSVAFYLGIDHDMAWYSDWGVFVVYGGLYVGGVVMCFAAVWMNRALFGNDQAAYNVAGGRVIAVTLLAFALGLPELSDAANQGEPGRLYGWEGFFWQGVHFLMALALVVANRPSLTGNTREGSVLEKYLL
jgi:hypothetical protein